MRRNHILLFLMCLGLPATAEEGAREALLVENQ